MVLGIGIILLWVLIDELDVVLGDFMLIFCVSDEIGLVLCEELEVIGCCCGVCLLWVFGFCIFDCVIWFFD